MGITGGGRGSNQYGPHGLPNPQQQTQKREPRKPQPDEVPVATSTNMNDLANFLDQHPDLESVLESAARLQQLVPDAVLVGGTAAAVYAHHRDSYDHDHTLDDLRGNFDLIDDALDREPDWVLNRQIPGKIILGSLGGIETGLRQLIRARPLEVCTVTLPSGAKLTVPTLAETERVKAYLIVKRNQVRDYLDVAAMADMNGIDQCGDTLAKIDDYYRDETRPEGDVAVATQLARQLASPQPKDSRTIGVLPKYKGLAKRWHDWDTTVTVCRELSSEIVNRLGGA